MKRRRRPRSRIWWRQYRAYLLSPEWLAKRQRVLLRCRGICEGCERQGAVQIHHLRYPQDCVPGSAQWIAEEVLMDLQGLCIPCHKKAHRRRGR